MSKIICDVCGTAYPETSTQCPICGCVRSADAQSVAGTAADSAAGTYTYVKGGRFSKSNVRKRNRSNQQTGDYVPDNAQSLDSDEPSKKKSNTGLVITAVVLLLAIIAIVIYIALRFFMPALPDNTEPSDTAGITDTTSVTDATVPCQQILLDVKNIVMDGEIGAARMLYATILPADTTDAVIYESSDEAVVTVSNTGKITVIGSGEAFITVRCGSVSAQCKVICNIEDPTEDTTTEATEDTTAPDEELRLNRSDITFSSKDSSWVIYNGKISPSKITWRSDDDKVATIDNGTVVAVGPGTTQVHAEYNGMKASCIIRCVFADDSSNQGVGGTGGVTEDGGGNNTSAATISHSDVTIHAGSSESFALTLSVNGEAVSVTWSVDDSAVCSVSGSTVTAIAAGTATVSATYNGQTYSCVVRVVA